MAWRSRNPLGAMLAIVVVLTSSVYFFQSTFESQPQGARLLGPTAQAGSAQVAQHYSPFENLEQMDQERLDSAQRSIDIAMYAFTDRYLAEKLAKLARRGVQIRLYRDREQYEEEEQRIRGTTTSLLRGQTGIQIRIKGSRELMHLKAYLIDGSLLRDGSANWSPSGLKRQDNNAHFTSDRAQIAAFQQIFEQMWNRADNERVQ